MLTGAVRVDRSQLAGGDALAYAAGVAGVLAAADAVGGPDVGVLASGALNAGSVALTSGLDRPRLTMAVAALSLGAATGAVGARALDTVVGSVLTVAVHITIRGPVLRRWWRHLRSSTSSRSRG